MRRASAVRGHCWRVNHHWRAGRTSARNPRMCERDRVDNPDAAAAVAVSSLAANSGDGTGADCSDMECSDNNNGRSASASSSASSESESRGCSHSDRWRGSPEYSFHEVRVAPERQECAPWELRDRPNRITHALATCSNGRLATTRSSRISRCSVLSAARRATVASRST